MTQPFVIPPGETCELDQIPTRVETDDFTKKTAYEHIENNAKAMADHARRLYAENRRSLLLVLQGMDAAGKDGTIRTVMRGVNPRSCQVHSFKKPSEEELDHDFLWRIHKRVPRKGNIGIFNRSHYEDVLVVRVRQLAPQSVWQQRYEQINQFEKLLADTGTVIVKCYLHISRDEQRERLQARIDDPDAHWKVNLGDLEERELWNEYRQAYNTAIARCNTSYAPWHIIPADRKWYRSLVVSELIRNTLDKMDPQYPDTAKDYRGIVVQ